MEEVIGYGWMEILIDTTKAVDPIIRYMLHSSFICWCVENVWEGDDEEIGSTVAETETFTENLKR